MGRDRVTKDELETSLTRIKAVLSGIRILDDERGPGYIENVRAYVSDTRFFMDKKEDLVLAFEAVTWAWAWVEIGCDLGVLASDEPRLQKF